MTMRAQRTLMCPPSRSRISFTPNTMLRHFHDFMKIRHAQVTKPLIFFNGHTLIANGVVDQQQKFHPTSTRLCSHCEQSTHLWGVAVIKAEACCHFNGTRTSKETMNDCSDSTFGAETEGFPDADHGQCYCYMAVSTNENRTKHFKSKAIKNKIEEDLRAMQTIGFAAMIEIQHIKLKKCPNET